MRWIVRIVGIAAATALWWGTHATPAAAQGVTTASVRGTIVDEAGQPVQGAAITLTNTRTGQRFQSVSRGDGRYNLENVAVGGPYTLQVRLLGYQPASRANIILTLGQVMPLDIVLSRAAVELEAVTVTAEQVDPVTAPSRTGMAGFVSDSAVRRLPTLNRNFTDFVRTVPQVVELNSGAPSLAGGHNRMNSVQIDGVSDDDLFGLGATGQPGGQVDAKSISLEAIKEYQVLIAPFDVRHNQFAGGVLNAVTKRGTNQWRGSGFWYWQSDRLVGSDTAGNRLGELTRNQRGFSLGGPIVRDRAHLFAAFEWEQDNFPVGGQTIGDDPPSVVGIAADSAQRLVDIMQNVYGQDAGDFRLVTLSEPVANLFGRLDFQLSDNHVLTIRHNHVEASGESQSHSQFNYRLASHRNSIKNVTNSTVAQLNSTLGQGRFYNELRVGFMRIEDRRNPNSRMPEIRIEVDSDIGGQIVPGRMLIGAERFSQANELDQSIFEITNDFTLTSGRHILTLGTHNEFISFRNLFFPTSIGQWGFDSLEDLEDGDASFFFRLLPFPGKGIPEADWNVAQLGFYVQDQWDVQPGLRLTLGVRADIPIINDNPDVNQSLLSGPIGRSTADMPSGNIHWAPRVGFNWDVRGDRTTIVRGGVGVFTARPAYVWLSNSFTNTGEDVVELFCGGGNVPTFTPNPDQQPTTCADGSTGSAPSAAVNLFSSDFRFPQTLKANIGIDRRLPGNVVGTLEVLYTRAVNSLFQQELNIPSEPIATNAEGRQMFGASGFFGTPQRVDPNFVQVLDHLNENRDRTWVVSLQFQKRFEDRLEFNASYSYMDAKDLTSLSSSIATSNFGFRPVSEGGNPNNPPLSTSAFEVPHRLQFSGTVNLPRSSSVSFIFTGQSGTPYTWTVFGDANGDGFMAPNAFGRTNDIIYVPSGPTDFSPRNGNPVEFENFDRVIDAEPCLQESRGRIPERNTCRNPWRNRLDLKFQLGLDGARHGHRISLIGDVFNVLNLISDDLGRIETISFFETRTLLQDRGFDAANDRPIYSYAGPRLSDLDGDGTISRDEVRDQLKSISDVTSRWRIQLGIRYDF